MKTLDLKVEFTEKELKQLKEDAKPIELVINVFKNIILNWGNKQRGLNEEDRRKYWKIIDALEASKKEGKETVELEDDWFGFLKKCKREVTLMPDEILRKVEVIIDAVKNK